MAYRYCSVASANEYMRQERLVTDAWDAIPNDEDGDILKGKALTQATALIDRLQFYGAKTDAAQEREFPRNGDTEVPQDIMRACAEIAYALLDGVDPEIEFQNLSLTTQGFANVRAGYDRTLKPEHYLAGIPSFKAWTYLKPFLTDNRSIHIQRVS